MFAFLDGADGSTWVLAVSTALIGGLVGAEVPLLMTLLQRGHNAGPADTGRTLANLNAADYLGALIGGLVWPFALLPHLGMIRGAAATGIVNLVAAAVVSIFLLRRVVSLRQLVTALCALAAALTLLTTLLLSARDIETTSRQRLYSDPIIAYRHTAYQEIVVTRRGNDTRLYLDGGLQFPPATSTATPKAWSTPRSAAVRIPCWYSAAATAWPPANCCASPASSGSCRSSWTPRSSSWPAPRCARPTEVHWTTRGSTSSSATR